MPHARAGRRRDAQDGLRAGGEPLDPQHQRVAHRLRQVPLRAGARRGQQLLGEERVAVGALQQPPGQLALGRRAEDPGELLGQLGRAEALQLDPLDAAGTLLRGQERAQRMAPVQLVAAIGGDQQQRLAAQVADQEREQVAGRAVGPVQVLDGDDQRRELAQPRERAEQQLEQPPLLRRPAPCPQAPSSPGCRCASAGRAGPSTASSASPSSSCPSPRSTPATGASGSSPVAELDAGAREHAGAAGARPLGELGQQAGLADAGLAGDEHRARRPAAGRRERGLERAELLRAADEDGARDPARHRPIIDLLHRRVTSGRIRAAAAGPGGHVSGRGRAAAARRPPRARGTGRAPRGAPPRPCRRGSAACPAARRRRAARR